MTYVLVGLVVLALVLRFVQRGFRTVATDLSGVELLKGDGTRVRMGELVDRPTLLVLVRYYG